MTGPIPAVLAGAVLALLPVSAAALDCAGAPTLSCNLTVSSSTLGAPSTASTYPCGAPALYSGPERVFAFRNPVVQTVSFLLERAAPELDVVLIDARLPGGGCAESRCLDLGDGRVVSFDLGAGDYHVVVDGRDGAAGPFDLTAVCGAAIDPPLLVTVLDPNDADPGNDCVHEDKTLYLNPEVFSADVLFTIDTTGSQQPAIDNLKVWSRAIVERMDETIDDVRFALASYRDYPRGYGSCGYSAVYGDLGDFPYRRDLAMTNDLAALAAALEALQVGNGTDLPESIARALHESYADQGIGWRPGAARVVINLTDVVPHDCDLSLCNGTGIPTGLSIGDSTGRDPGRDQVMLTADDLEILPVLDEMAARGMILFDVFTGHPTIANPPGPNPLYAPFLALWQCWCGVTGGAVFDSNPSLDTTLVADTITAAIRDQVTRCGELRLSPAAGFASWVRNLTPASLVDAGLPGVYRFALDICPDPATPPGDYWFAIEVACDDLKLAEQRVEVTVPAPAPCTPEVVAELSSTRVCAGEVVGLEGRGSSVPGCNGPVEHRWRGTNGFLRDWSPLADAEDAPATTTGYTLDVRCLDPGCQASSAPQAVLVDPRPTAGAGPPRVACPGEPVVLGGAPTGAGGTPPLTYLWTATPPDPSMSCSSGPACAAPTANPAGSTAYTVRVSDSSGCFAEATALVALVPPGPPPGIGNTVRAIRQREDLVLSWAAPGAAEAVFGVRRSARRDFAASEVRASFAASLGTTATLGGDAGSPERLLLYRVTTTNCANDESPF